MPMQGPGSKRIYNMFKMLDYMIKFIALMAFTYGSWLAFGTPVAEVIRDTLRVRKIMRSLKPTRGKEYKNPVIRHLGLALSIILKREVTYEPYLFLTGSLLIFIFSLMLLIVLESLAMTLIFSSLLAVIPYMTVQALLRRIRIDGSYDGVTLVTGLINNYKHNFFNMLEALDKTAGMSALSYFSKNNLLRLSMKLKSYRTEEELDEAIRTFVFAYETEWSVLLGMNIKIAVLDGTEVSTSLDDILTELKHAGEAVEANKRFNNESFSMIRFLLVPLYLFTVYLCVSVFGFTLQKFLKYQFLTELGLKSAVTTFSGIIISFILLILFKKPKYDI